MIEDDDDTGFEEQLAAGALQAEARDLAFRIADDLCTYDIETNHYKVAMRGMEWLDLRMLHNADHRLRVDRAVRYLELRGFLKRHEQYRNLVRVERPEVQPPC